mmetsp:Transcript_38900/g.121539  ORF Transcript_38900/g.121539 Transcript_38900/m.121539 type:complete len:417 (+) Transcript_38900:172-1422(+)
MLVYKKGYLGIFLLFRLSGTAWPHGVMPGLISATVGLMLGLLKKVDVVLTDDTQFLVNPYPYQLFTYIVGFILVFRTNFGYARYWDGLDAVQRMGAKWLDGACMAIAFDAQADPFSQFLQSSIVSASYRETSTSSLDKKTAQNQGPDHAHFFEEVLHLFSLIHALAFQHLRCCPDLNDLQQIPVPRRVSIGELKPTKTSSSSNLICNFSAKDRSQQSVPLKLPVLGGVTPEEFDVLEADSDGNIRSSLARIAMVESWIMRRLTARQKHEPAGDMGKTSAPILSRMVQVLSDGHLAFSQAAKVAEAPFPFPYHNILSIFLWMFACFTPFMVNANLINIPARFVVNFIAVWAYFSLSEVGDNLEDPYLAYDPNDLPLEALHQSFNARLMAFGVVPSSEGLQAQESAPVENGNGNGCGG